MNYLRITESGCHQVLVNGVWEEISLEEYEEYLEGGYIEL